MAALGVLVVLVLVLPSGSAQGLSERAAAADLPRGLTVADWTHIARHIGTQGSADSLPVYQDHSAAVFLGTFGTQEAYLKASNTGYGDFFGYSVAISGDTVVVGARNESSSATGVDGSEGDNSASESGAAYVFVRSGNTWTQQAYLKASNTEAEDWFGYSVAISGDTVVVGAFGEDSSATGVNGTQSDNSASRAGAAYVFVRSGSTWTQQAYLKASNTYSTDFFGYSVAISGDTVVVGASGEGSSATGINGDGTDNNGTSSYLSSGAAYVFTRSGTTWTQQAYLKASDTNASDYFGSSVAISADTVVVGATGEDSSVTGINGDGSDNSAAQSGAAYVFFRSGSTWTQQAYLKASNTGSGDYFGRSVAISGDTVVVGADYEDSSAIGVNGAGSDNSAADSGAAYVFARSGDAWSQQAYLKASNTGTEDRFGHSVAVSGDTVVVGADYEDSGATGVDGSQGDGVWYSGAAYVFTRSGGTWAQDVYLKASNTDSGDYFGCSVAVSGDTVIVGAREDDSSATGVNGDQGNDGSFIGSGAVYVFRGGSVVADPPVITGLDPTTGLTVGGNVVTITGAYFTGVTAVTFGGTPADGYSVDSATQITAVAPAHAAGTVDVVVTGPGGTSSNTSADDFTYVTGTAIGTEGFESGMGGWTVEGAPTWGVTSYRAAGGSQSAYCVGSSVSAPGPYPNDVDAFMYAGPYDLSTATTGVLEFDQFSFTEEGYDYCYVMASANGTDFSGWGWSGDSGGWEHVTLDLSAWPDGEGGFVDLVGDSSVWIGFWFVSDDFWPEEGVYLDNVQVVISDASPSVSYTSIIGSDRFDTAMKISQAMYPSGLAAGSGVVLAPGWESYQEALCGAPLAAAWNGPVLLSSKTVLYSGVATELVRLNPDQVFCIGLTPALAAAVQLVLPGATVTSINGTLDNVYHMSYLVAKKLGERVDLTGGDISSATGIVTVGTNFPDAIGVGPLACAKLWPVILTDKGDGSVMHDCALDTFTDLGMTTYIKAGTYAADPSGVVGLTNCSGDDRYWTNQKVAIWAEANAGLTYTHTALTTGDKFPDALAGGPYLALDNGTLLLSPLTGPLPTQIGDLISANSDEVRHFTFLACIEPVISQVKGCLP